MKFETYIFGFPKSEIIRFFDNPDLRHTYTLVSKKISSEFWFSVLLSNTFIVYCRVIVDWSRGPYYKLRFFFFSKRKHGNFLLLFKIIFSYKHNNYVEKRKRQIPYSPDINTANCCDLCKRTVFSYRLWSSIEMLRFENICKSIGIM